MVNSMQSEGSDWATANINMANTTLEGISPLPDLDETIAQLGEGGFDQIRTIKFTPGFFGLIATSIS
jgi:hypothetical protein